MNKFNMCNNYHMVLCDMVIPKGAFYGKDHYGYWVCIQKELYPMDTPTLELYRWNNAKMGWVLLIESSETVSYIKKCADKNNLWNIKIEYPKYKGIHEISANMDKTVKRSHKNKMKQHNDVYQFQIPLDSWEKSVCHCR